MVHNRFLRIVCGIALFALCTAPLLAQATFGIASSTVTGADIGVTELTGQITLSVLSGTTVSSQFLIKYSAPITTNYQVEIRVRGTGGLASVAPYPLLLRPDNTIIIDVPAGGNIGNMITIAGVRVSLASGNYTKVTASVSAGAGGGNAIAAGQETVTVINAILKPFSVDLTREPPLSYTRGTITNGSSSLTIIEGYAGAFTDAVGVLGQTIPTTIRVTPFPTELPPGVSVTLAGSVISSSGAVFATPSGEDQKIPRQDGTVEVIYQYMGGSQAVPQSFTIPVSLSLEYVSDTGMINFQCTLIPIGVDVPNQDFPSKDVPRYRERVVPEASQLPGVQNPISLNFPFRAQSDGVYTGIALTNTLGSYINVTLTPFDSNGSPILAPKILTIPPKYQIAKLATDVDMFGPNFNVGKAGTIVAEGNTLALPGFYLLGDFNGSRLDGATAEMNSLRSWVWPTIFRQTPAAFTTLEIFNPNVGRTNAILSLIDANGKVLQTASLSVASFGTAAQSIQQFFPAVDFNSFSGGYIRGEADAPLVVRETFGNSLDANVLPGQTPRAFDAFYWPHFASGGGLTTELTFVNTDASLNATLNITIFDSSGIDRGQAQVVIPSGGQVSKTIADLFPTLPASQSIVGYIRVDNIPTHIGPFVFTPLITAALRFSAANGSGSAALPASFSTFTEFVYSHAVETAGYYTGIAILNKNVVPASVTVDVYTNAGIAVGTGLLTLQPGEKIAKLLHELVPAANGQLGGYVRIQSDQPVMSLSIFGSNNGLSLSAIPPQNIGK